ncbi:MAG: DUF3592 domain-containing protein [Acidobacteria bacterium]|nr:DUF3592 domain-containing protein [Acidobacteriota bacterium]
MSFGSTQNENDFVRLVDPELACPTPRTVRLKIGPKFKFWVVYLILVLVGNYKSVFSFPVFAVVLVLMLIPVLILGFTFLRSGKSRALVSRGVATRGIVEDLEIKEGEDGNYYLMVVTYDTPVAHLATRLEVYERGSSLRPWRVGDTLTILYSPEAPEKAMAYRYCAYKAVRSRRES